MQTKGNEVKMNYRILSSIRCFHFRDYYYTTGVNGQATIVPGASSGASSTSSSNGRSGGPNPSNDYHVHHHSHFPPPAHHHHPMRADNLRAAEALHAQLLREAHVLKPGTAWGNPGLQPQSFQRQDVR